eukprot:3672697-Rhodomonas_salina.5
MPTPGGRDRPLPVICLDELHNVESGGNCPPSAAGSHSRFAVLRLHMVGMPGENFSIDPPLRKFLQ